MNILITGGAGYIGSVVAELLENNGHSLIIIDDLSEGNLKAISNKSIFYKDNFGNHDLLNSIFTKHSIDIVFHFAASANVPHSKIDPLLYYENNLSNTISLLNYMKKFKVNKIIFSSTAAVYGEPKYSPIDENHPLAPINPYGYSKLTCEQIIMDCCLAYGLKYMTFRYFCAAGATKLHGESRKNETHLIPIIIDTILRKREFVPVFGLNFNTPDKSGVRDYIHVIDIAKAHINALNVNNNSFNQTFNLGTENGYSVIEVINAAEEVFNEKIKYSVKQPRAGDPAILVASCRKVSEIIGWKTEYDLKDILLSAFEWRKNPLYFKS